MDIKLSIYRLFYTLLLQKSRHFNSDPNLYSTTMQYFIESLTNQDINICKQSLTLLDTLNEKQRLYSSLLRTSSYIPLLNTLFSVLFNKMHNILKEDLIATIYKVASVDLNYFYGQVKRRRDDSNFLLVFRNFGGRISNGSATGFDANISRRKRSNNFYREV